MENASSMGAEQCEHEILWELNIKSVNLCDMSFANVNLMRTDVFKYEVYEFYESWAELCKCEFF